MKYQVCKTYNEVTPESAENGDFSDTGFVYENREFTLEELMHEIKVNGSFYHPQRDSDRCLRLIDQEAATDYTSGTDRTEDLFIESSKAAIDALIAALNLNVN